MADLPESPDNRTEDYLAGIAGDSSKVPSKPWSRKEAYLQQILENGGGGGVESFVFYIKETDVHSGTGTEIALYKDAACTQKYTVGEVTSAYTSGKQIIARTNYGSYIQELKCTSISSPVEITDANLDQQGFHLGFFFGGYSGGGNGYCVYIGTYWGLAYTDVWDYSME